MEDVYIGDRTRKDNQKNLWIDKLVNGRFRTVEINDQQLKLNKELRIKQYLDKTTVILTMYYGDNEDNELMDKLWNNGETFKFVTYNTTPGKMGHKNSFICKAIGIEIISNINEMEGIAYYLEVLKLIPNE